MALAQQVRAVARTAAPGRLLHAARPVRDRVVAARSRGDRVSCPVCGGSFRGFAAFNRRPDARCPGCGALERHRLLWAYLDRATDLFSRPQRVLHVAPEPFLRARLAAVHGEGYVHGDVADPEHRVDVTDLPFADGSFDVVLCSHVFEHVPDDLRAMRELRRVLRPGGWAVLDAPVDEARAVTFEDGSITTAAGRRRAFKQWDHVRVYGRDYRDRLRAAGWVVELDPWQVEPHDASRFGLRPGTDRVHRCRPAPAA